MYSEITSNKRKTYLILSLFLIIIAGFSYIVSRATGNVGIFPFAVIGSFVYALFSYFGAGKLAVVASGAHEVTKKDEPRLYRTVENLCITTGMPMPKVYVTEDAGLNAFATGRDPDHALVCATRGLLDTMDNNELTGVLAHELGHIKNYDIRVMMITMALVGVISFIADIFLRMSFWGGMGNKDDDNSSSSTLFFILAIVAAILAPITATLIQLAISRRREYLADATGALTTRYPEGLASALEKIGQYGSTLKKQNTATAHLYIANPLKGNYFASLFSTHPPIADRVAKLRAMGSKL